MICCEYGCKSKAKPGSNYCYGHCVRKDSSPLSSDIKSEPTGRSGSDQPGDQSEILSSDESAIETEPSEIKSLEPLIKNENTGQTQSDTENWEEGATYAGALITQQNSDTKRTSVVPELIHHEPSVEHVASFKGVRSTSMSIIDDSILHMHDLQKSVVDMVKERASKDDNRVGSIDPMLVNSAVKVSKQLAQMMKLKMDLFKVVVGSK